MAKENLVQKHVLVAKHTKLGEKPSKDLLTSLDITKEQLPKILIKDPAIKDLEINPGDIIKIERTSPTSGKSLYYRVVVG